MYTRYLIEINNGKWSSKRKSIFLGENNEFVILKTILNQTNPLSFPLVDT